MRFADTNVLLYSVSTDPGEQDKQSRADEILRSPDIGLSTQVLAEFYVQATRPTRADPLPAGDAADLVETFTRFTVVDITAEIVMAAIATQRRFRISYWDAAIVEAARALDCDEVLSEDLSDGQDYAGVRVSNPF